MRTPKLWRLSPAEPDLAHQLGRELNLPPVLAQLLLNRGVRTADGVRAFLGTPLAGLHDPKLLPGVAEASAALHAAVRAKKRICIYGDYDVDGITGATILWRCLKLAGAEVEYYVPDRLEEGYGLNSEALRKIKESGIDIVVTVDCGIGSVQNALDARNLGLQLIITDHHEMKDELPQADVLVHPRLPGSTYPFPHLCGAGVAFKLGWAIAQEFSQARKVSEAFRSFLLESVALVALGTVADVMPVLDENRIFVHHGLRSLQQAPTLGLKALLDAAGLSETKALNAEHIGFTLAPRLNAAGRLGHARLAIELLSTGSAERAQELARYLNAQNEARQTVERRILSEARKQAESLPDFEQVPAFVLHSADWHPGVIGIVASRLVDRYARPVLMIAGHDDLVQGSGRSVEGCPLHEALAACGRHLVSHGGHAMAAGFRVRKREIPEFRAAFEEYTAQRLKGHAKRHTLHLDAELPLSAITPGLLAGIQALHPHGPGNRRPLFLAGGLQLVGEPRKVGQGERHLSFRVRQDAGPVFKAIAFGMGDRLEELTSAAGQCCLAFTPKRNEWNGHVTIDLEISDLQAGPVARLDTGRMPRNGGTDV